MRATRKQNRLIGFDYSQCGAYFLTLCITHREPILWHDAVGARIARPHAANPLTPLGEIVKHAILEIPLHYPMVTVDHFVVMPNHVHLLPVIQPDEDQRVPFEVDNGKLGGRAMRAPTGAVEAQRKTPTIATIINQLKGSVTKRAGFPIWQKSYHDHVIGSQAEYDEIWTYIEQNPLRWTEDCYYPLTKGGTPMQEIELKYGCNPNQKPARIFAQQGELPLTVLNGKPGYINFLDALNGWQLVRELKRATGLPAATSFKHVSPAGAAVGLPLTDTLRQIYFVPQDAELSPLACAYARARGADRMSSFGDWISLSDVCDVATAKLIKPEVSDGIIAPGYEPEAFDILMSKRQGNYNIVRINPNYEPPAQERKDVFGVTFEQNRNELHIGDDFFANVVTENKQLPAEALRDLAISMVTLKYTQSNSVCYVKDGQAIGIGAGQQSRIHCTRLAGDKANNWWLRQHEKTLALPFLPTLKNPDRDNAIDRYISDRDDEVLADGRWEKLFSVKPEALSKQEKAEWLRKLTGVALGSDAFFPFADNIDRAAQSGVSYIAEPGGSKRDQDVIDACNGYGIAMAFTGLRLFHH